MAAPSFSVSPSISSPSLATMTVVGKTLSASTGTYSGSPTSVDLQWRVANAGGGAEANISGEASSTYVVSVAATKWIRCRVTLTNIEGTAVDYTPWVTVFAAPTLPAVSVIGTKNDLAPYDGVFIINDHTISDSATVDMPDPVAWESDSPQGLIDFTCHCVASGQGSGNNRRNQRGATLISPSLVVCARHWTPITNLEFTTLAGVAVARTAVTSWDLGGDLRVMQLNTPVSAGVTPAALAANVGAVANGYVLGCELNRHQNLLSATPLTSSSEYLSFSATSVDIIEAGDSGHMIYALVDDKVVLLSSFYTASLGPNYAKYLDEICAIAISLGEEITLATLPVPVGASTKSSSTAIGAGIGI